jgi:hypothetical protein
MSRWAGVCVALLGLCGQVNWAGEKLPAGPAPQSRIRDLIAQLGAAEFDAREAAREELGALGEGPRAALEAALQSGDPEVSASAGRLLRALNRAVIAVRVVGPDDKPIAEAVVRLCVYQKADPPGDRAQVNVRQGRVSILRQNEAVSSDAQGWCVFKDFDPGAGYQINASCQAEHCIPGALSVADATLKVGCNEYTLSCRRGGTVKGVLLDKDRKPVGACAVHLVQAVLAKNQKTGAPWMALLRRQPNVATDAKGAFVFDALRPMEYAVVMMDEQKVLYRGEPLKIEGDATVNLGEILTGLDPAALARKEEAKTDGQAETQTLEQ